MLGFAAVTPRPTAPNAWAAVWERARAEWPQTTVTPARFAQVCAASGLAPEALRAGDLLWTLSALAGDGPALQALERKVAALLGAMALPASDRAELARQAMAQLVVGSPERAAKLTQYRPQAPLGAWLHVLLTRLVSDARRGVKQEVELDDAAMLGEPVAELEPELRLAKAQYGPIFSAAFRAALKGLTARQRNLLRQHYLDAVSLDQLGIAYRAHRATVARWLQDARTQVLVTVRDEFRRRAGLEGRELDSLLELVRSRLEFTAGVFVSHEAPVEPDLQATQGE